MSDNFDYKMLADALLARQLAAKEGIFPAADQQSPALEKLKEAAQEKREKGEWTFQKPMKDRGWKAEMNPLKNEQYVGKPYEALPGISEAEIAAVRARGPARDADGNLTLQRTKAEAPEVPTRSQETYLQAGLKPDVLDAKKSKYDSEETEKGDWREVPAGATGIKTPYYRGAEQEKHRVQVGDDGKLKGASGDDLDTSAAAGGRMTGSTPGREIFAMDTTGGVFTTDPVRTTSAAGVVDDPHHSSLVHGEKVVGAGEFETHPADKGTLRAVSDTSGHYVPTPGHTADVINELEAQGASMIGGGVEADADGKVKPRNKRAKVELSYNEDGTFVGAGKPGAVTMDFERFSQTGGNLPQAKKKRQLGEELKRRAVKDPAAADPAYQDPDEVLKPLRKERAADRAVAKAKREAEEAEEEARKKKAVPRIERVAAWAEKAKTHQPPLDWSTELRDRAGRAGVQFKEGYGWMVKDQPVDSVPALLAILADPGLDDTTRAEEVLILNGMES